MLKPQINSPDYQFHLPPLGDGTFGTVYRATYRGVVDRAVKVFKPGVVDLPSIMLELEKLSAVAEHQGIVTLHDFDLRGEVPYYVMSLHADQAKDGTWKARTLEDLCGQVDAREAGRLIDQIADAMAYLHRHQVLHCDLKPRNILLTNETPPSIKICDFGQSRGVRLAALAGWGTPFYSSPEQLLHPDDWLDGKGFLWDVYSFGVVAYRLITGKLPRLQSLAGSGLSSNRLEGTLEDPDTADDVDDAGERVEQWVKLLRDEAEVVWPSRARIDRRRKAILTRCLSLDPSQRLRDMRDVRNTIFREIQGSRTVRSRNVAVLFGAISALALGASGKALVEASRVREANAREEEKRNEAEELVNFIVHHLAEDLDPAGRAELLEHIAENAATYFSNMPSDSRTERSLQSFARVLETRGWAALVRGDAKLAIDSYQKAHNLSVQLERDGKGQPGFRSAGILEKLGDAQALANALGVARLTYRQALEAWAAGPESPEVWLARARLHRRLAVLERGQGNLGDAVQHISKARALHEKVDQSAAHRRQREQVSGYLGAYLEQGELLLLQGQAEQARAAFLQVVDRGKEDSALVLRDVGLMKHVAQAYGELAGISLREKPPGVPLVREYLQKELEFREAIYWREPTDPARTFALAQCLASLARHGPASTPEDMDLARSRLEQALSYLRGVEGSGVPEGKLKVLRESCLAQIEDLSKTGGNATATVEEPGGSKVNRGD